MVVPNETFVAHNGETVVDYVIRQMQEALINGKLKAGDRLPSEFELMEEFNVSRNSIREAMKVLSAVGVISIKRGDGTYVSEDIKPNAVDAMIYSVILGGASSEELGQLREVLEIDMLEFVIAAASDDEIDNIVKADIAMRKALEQGDMSTAGKLDLQFHLLLVEATHNAFFARMLRALYSLFYKSIETNLKITCEDSIHIDPHKEIIKSICDRDPSQAVAAIKASLKSWRQDVKEKMK